MKLTYKNQPYTVHYYMEDGFPAITAVYSRVNKKLRFIQDLMYESLQDDLNNYFSEQDDIAREERALAELDERRGK